MSEPQADPDPDPAPEPGVGAAARSACLNCATPLVDLHCHRCGQAAHVHRTLGGFFHEFLHGVVHFEGRIWRTLPRLVLDPGRLTREYIDGRRASYVSPVALFLFGVFLMFAIVRQLEFPVPDTGVVSIDGRMVRGVGGNFAEIARLKREREAVLADGRSVASLDAQISARQQALDAMVAVRAAAGEADGRRLRGLDIRTGAEWLDRAIGKARSNPGLAVYRIQGNAYKFSWILIPLSVPFVWLLFARGRRFPLYDHFVFVTYSLGFMTLLVTVVAALVSTGLASASWLATAVPPVHVFRQLRGAYGLGRLEAAWRTLLLIAYAIAALLTFAMLLLLISGG